MGHKSIEQISLKGNQKTIHDDVKEVFDHTLDQGYCEAYKIKHVEYDTEIGLKEGLKNVNVICVQILIGFLKKLNGQILMQLEC